MSRKWKRWLIVALAALGLAGLSPVAGLYFSSTLLCVEHPGSTGEVMVVLGGEFTQRPGRALELFRQQVSPRIIISGYGDCEAVGMVLAARGVPRPAMQLECRSRNTSENAQFTVPLLRDLGARRVVVVTSWFHSRRALNCFRHYAPDIEFVSLPTVADRPTHWPNRYQREWVLSEYLKLAGYWVRYAVSPF